MEQKILKTFKLFCFYKMGFIIIIQKTFIVVEGRVNSFDVFLPSKKLGFL